MADRVSTTKLIIETDKRSSDAAGKALDNLDSKLNTVAKDAAALDRAANQAGGGVAGAFQGSTAPLDTLIDKAQEAEAQLRAMEAQAEKTGGAVGGIKATQSLGNVAQGAGAAGALVSQISPQAGQFIQLGQQIASAAKDVPNLVSGLGQLATQGAAAIPGVSGLATGLASAIPALGAGGAAMAAIALPAAALAGIIAPLVLVIKNWSDAAAELKANAEAIAKAESDKALQDAQLDDLITAANAGNKNARAKILDDLAKANETFDNLNKQRIKLENDRNAAQAEADKQRAIAANASGFLGFSQEGQAALGAANAAQAAVDAFNKQLEDNFNQDGGLKVAGKTLADLNDAAKAIGITANESSAVILAVDQGAGAAADKLAELAQSGQDGVKSAEELKKAEEDLANQRQSSQDKINALNAQNAKAQSDFAEGTTTINAARRVRDRREEQDYQEARSKALEQHNAKLADIAAQGAAKIEQINSQLADIPAERQGKIVAAESKYNQDVSKINADYMKSELAAVRKFAADEAKINQQNAKNRLRELQDLGDNLADAELSNDVVRFIQTKREGEKRLAREAQDADAAAQERAAQFAADRAAADQARQERLQAAAEALAQEKADIDAAAAQKRAQLQQQIADEQAAIAQRTAAEIAGFQKSEQEANAAREKRLARQKEDDGIADAARKRQLDKQLADIVQKTNAETAALNTILAKVNQIGTAASAIRTNFSSSPSSNSGSNRSFVANTSGGSTRRGSGIFLSAFAEGGIVPKGTSGFGFFEGKQSEAVIPLDKFNPGGQAGAAINLSVNVNGLNVGKIVSAEEVTATARQLAQQAGHEVLELIAKANVNARFRS